ncbi:MAG TPA: hypothetical protein VK483_14015 [Chitinophagaceae bacterium]|nr:hypothetical protein [Chitinophagaceae bacterium]
MKKLCVTLCLSAILLLSSNSVSYSQSRNDFLNQSQMYSYSDFINNGYKKVGVAFRHHGNGHCTCPHCVCPGCPCPIGVCICIDLKPVALSEDQGLTETQISQGYGIVWVKLSATDNLMHIIFLSANDEHDVCPVDTSPYVDNTDASKFNSSSAFTVSNGDYAVYKSKYTYGEIVVTVSY